MGRDNIIQRLHWLAVFRASEEQVIEERFADTYHALMTDRIRHLQETIKEKSDVSISVSEVNSRAMDKGKDQDIPAWSQLSG